VISPVWRFEAGAVIHSVATATAFPFSDEARRASGIPRVVATLNAATHYVVGYMPEGVVPDERVHRVVALSGGQQPARTARHLTPLLPAVVIFRLEK
jgi:hypothetical protein